MCGTAYQGEKRTQDAWCPGAASFASSIRRILTEGWRVFVVCLYLRKGPPKRHAPSVFLLGGCLPVVLLAEKSSLGRVPPRWARGRPVVLLSNSIHSCSLPRCRTGDQTDVSRYRVPPLPSLLTICLLLGCVASSGFLRLLGPRNAA